jgi:hypothetical protein
MSDGNRPSGAAERIEEVIAEHDARAADASRWVATLRRYLAAARTEADRREGFVDEIRRRRRTVADRTETLRMKGADDAADEEESKFARALDRYVGAFRAIDLLEAPTRVGPAIAFVDASGNVLPEFPDPVDGPPAPATPFAPGPGWTEGEG